MGLRELTAVARRLARARAVVTHRRAALVHDLAHLVGIPSVSGDPAHAPDLEAAARWLAARLRAAGIPHAGLVRSGGPPAVLGVADHRPGVPRVLVYAHYDVQPAGATRWATPPFTLTRRGDHLHGRGSADDKGPLLAHIHGLEAVRATGRPGVEVSYLFDGEEEIGSPHLPAVLDRIGALVASDAVVVSDTRLAGPDLPALVRSLRGSVTVDLRVDGPARPLHVGAWAGAVRNPAHVLADLVSSLHRSDGTVAIEGFYDGLDLDGPGIDRAGTGRRGTSSTMDERAARSPALTVTRLHAGGSVMAIPASARARINLRLVTGQDPARVAALLRRHVEQAAGGSVATRMRVLGAVAPVTVAMGHPAARAAARAYADVFGVCPVETRSGGTIAAVAHLSRLAPVVLMGLTPDDARIHAPDERMHVPTLWRAAETVAAFLLRCEDEFAQ